MQLIKNQFIHLLVTLFGVFLFATLSACGGGGDKGSGTADGEPLAEGVNIISFVKASDGEETTSVTTDDSFTVKIRLLSASNQPMQNERVEVEASVGEVAEPSLTDVNGESTFSIIPPTSLTEGVSTGTLVVSFGTFSKTINYEFVATSTGGGDGDSSAASIQFISATPETISLKGTGGVGLQETSIVIFKVVDLNGAALEGEEVNFKLDTTTGGVTLSKESALTDSSGQVSVVVSSGSVSGPVRVTAFTQKADGTEVSVQSNQLTISTGLPDQNSFSLSFESRSVESYGIDNVTNTVTVRLADHFNNPVPEGTIVNFTTEGGTIPASCLTDATGVCSVDWVSSNPRPEDHRVTILAYAIGNETLNDANGNGVFDDGDSFEDIGEVFRDDDESGDFNIEDNSFSQNEILIDYDNDGAYTAADSVYNGVFCEHSSQCPTTSDNLAGRSNLLLNVSAQATMVMASSYPTVELYRNDSGSNSCFDSNGKLRAGCDIVTNYTFLAGGANQRFNALIADSVVKCTDSSGNRVESTDPDDAVCAIVERQSAANGASIAISSEVGEAPTSLPSIITSRLSHIEQSFVLVSSADNADVEAGELKLIVTMPESNNTVEASISLTDSIN